ncbi:MAG: YwbE family protein [Acidobacteria bacterium]|nr:MAG: YwbE family protein [Acidobacteriota bacterium]REJ99140.1 MAG: YwbE family protein [Acidobacteriota bacterium]REK16139.1 MAG: YwbE family protein [Acidobacteriota bacterium]REK43820.1 MAG: YwbE family protein [Acidobacteriota bacterium]
MKYPGRDEIKPDSTVSIVRKQDQRTGKEVEGTVRDILTRSRFHPHGIKVRLDDGSVGRVKRILSGTEE